MSAHPPRPWVGATAMALSYGLVCGLYIWASDAFVARVARDVDQLERFQLYKGLGFIAVTAAALFVMSLLQLRSLARHEEEMRNSRSALLASERRATAGIFAASVAHDINNILTVLQVETERMPQDDPADGSYELVARAIEDLRGLSRQLMAAGREGMPGRAEPRDLAEVVRESVEFVRKHASVRYATVSVEAGSPVPMTVNPAMIEHMLMNLVLNAAEATSGRGRVRVVVRRTDRGARIEVHDDGPGIAPENRTRVFDPFYTSKHGGSGLGLLSVKSCADAHGGTVEIGDSPLGGACFTVTIPDAGEPPGAGR